MSWDTLIDVEFSGRLCLTLFHSVWQVAVLAATAWAVDRVWGRRSVERSYALYVTALLVSLAAMPITYAVVEVAAPPAVANSSGAVEAVAPVPTPLAAALDEPSPAVGEVEQTANTGGQPPARDTARSLPVAAVAKGPSTLWLRAAPWIVALYAVGVLFMLARLIACIWRAQRLGSGAQLIADGVLVNQLNALARTWSMRVVPALARVEQIAVPKVVGLARPTILLPASAITGLSPDELEMILAHELAHVRRYDMWVNLLQRFAEVALFFNPALWCLSRRISVLREYCCDELTCRATSDSGAGPRMRYASALLRVVELSRHTLGNHMDGRALEKSDVAALAASGRSPSELRRRVARLFGEPLREPVRLPRGGVLTLAVMAVLLVVGPSVWQSAADFTAARPAVAVEEGAETGDGDAPTVPAKENTDAEVEEGYSVPITVFGRALDVQGKPIAGAEIFLASRQAGTRLAQTTSAADGSYRFEGVSLPIERADTNAGKNRGSFEVFGIAEGYALTWRPKKSFYPDRKHVLDTWGDPNRDQPPGYGTEDPVELDLTFGPPKTIRGRVVDELGQPIPDTALSIRSCTRLLVREDGQGDWYPRDFESLNDRAIVPPRVKSRTTGADGRFEFTGLPANYRWGIDVRPPGHARRTIAAATREDVDSDANGRRVYSGDFEVVFARPRKLKLRVVYGDTGEPAPKVAVGGRVTVAGFFETTDDDGFVEALLPDGRYRVSLLPRYGTPYLRTESDVVVSAETVQETTTLQLRPAAVVDVTVIDADTGKPLPGVDVWLDRKVPGATTSHRSVHGYRSWEVETRISQYESPRSDANGKMRVLFEPGKHRIGVGQEAYPEGYEPVERDGKEVDCRPGEPISVEFRMRRKTAANRIGASSPVSTTARPGVAKAPPQKFELQVVGPDGKPVAEAMVEIRTVPIPKAEQIQQGTFVRKGPYGAFVNTDADGRLVVELPANPSGFNASIKTPGYGPYWAGWNSGSHPQPMPSKFVAELEAGWTLGGVIVDSHGAPIEDVAVQPDIKYKKRPGDVSELGVGTRIATDAEGKWSFDCVPNSMSEVHVSFNHPDFKPVRRPLTRSEFGYPLGQAPRAKIVLEPGLMVTGTVTDESGEPVAGALVRTKFLNDVREATTDERGHYRLIGCEPRMARIVVSAKGRATDVREVRVDPAMEPVDFKTQPGGHVRIRVVDEQDNPIPKARIFFQRWRGRIDYFEFDHVSRYTDENGVWEWDEAPLDEFEADICRPGGMQLLRQSLVARDEEYVFTPPRALVVSGTVIDAVTKDPVKRFRVVPGVRDQPAQLPGDSWSLHESYVATDGKYRIVRTRTSPVHLVRVEAEGYKVAISRDIKTDEGEVAIDFQLQPAQDIAATIRTANGEPAAGAKIALGVAGSQISVKNGDIDDGSTYATRCDADETGRFSFPGRDELFQLVITHPSGFAYLKSTDAPVPPTISLTPWARVEGTFRVGTRPVPNVGITLNADSVHSYGDDVPNIFTHYDVTTRQDGRFVFERVFPGNGRIGRRIFLIVNEGATEVTSSTRIAADFPPGETTRIDLGGAGRPVVGKLQPPDDFGETVLWGFALVNVQADLPKPRSPEIPDDVQADPEKREAWWQQWLETDEGKAWKEASNAYDRLRSASPYFTATIDPDGAFRIDDMPAGDYVLSVRFSEHAAGRLSGYRFSLPPIDGSRMSRPLDLGALALEKK